MASAKSKRGVNSTGIRDIKDEEAYIERIRKARRVVFGVLGISALVFLAIVAYAIYKNGTETLLQALLSVKLDYLFAAFATIFISYVSRFLKWEQYLRKLHVKISRKKNFLIYMSMYAMDITPGRLGRGIASYTINRVTGTRFAKTFPAVIADIFTDFLGFIALTLGTAPIFYLSVRSSPALLSDFLNTFALVLIFVFLLLLPFAFIYSRTAFLWFRKKLSNVKLFGSIFRSGDLYYKNIKKLDRSVYLYSMLITIPSMFLNGMALYLVMLSFGVNLGVGSIPTVLFIFSSSLIIGIVTGLPATLGITDFLLLSYLTLFFPGIGISTASLITIFFRIASVWFVELFGFIALFYTTRYWDVKKSDKVIASRS